MTDLKAACLQRCSELLAGKAADLQATLDDLRDAIAGDTKSTAGDKHETARAHLQIAQEQTARQLAAARGQAIALSHIDFGKAAQQIIAGSLVHTDNGVFFLSTAIGKLEVMGATVVALSPQSPLGTLLCGAGVGEERTFNGRRYRIRSIE